MYFRSWQNSGSGAGVAGGFSAWDQPFRGAKCSVGRAVLAPTAAALCSPPGTGSLRGRILARLFATPQHPVFLPAEPFPGVAVASNYRGGGSFVPAQKGIRLILPRAVGKRLKKGQGWREKKTTKNPTGCQRPTSPGKIWGRSDVLGEGPTPSPIGLCLEWCFLPPKSELRCVFAFLGGAISAHRRIGMFPGDVFRPSGSILLRHFPPPP